MRSGSHPGRRKAVGAAFHLLGTYVSGVDFIDLALVVGKHVVDPSGRTLARSERVQSNTGIKL